jgi:hypothetical protein
MHIFVCKKKDLCVQIRFLCRLHRDALVEAQECYAGLSLYIVQFQYSTAAALENTTVVHTLTK